MSCERRFSGSLDHVLGVWPVCTGMGVHACESRPQPKLEVRSSVGGASRDLVLLKNKLANIAPHFYWEPTLIPKLFSVSGPY